MSRELKLQQVQPEPRVSSLALDEGQRVARGFRQRLRGGIVFHDVNRLLAGDRKLHAGVQTSGWIERVFDKAELVERRRIPHTIEQRRSQPSVTMLAGECPAQRRDEVGDVDQDLFDTLTPIPTTNVDEG